MKITAKYLAFTSLTTQCSQGRSDTGVREFRAKSTGSAALMTLELAGNDSSHSVIRERASGWNLHANMLGQQTTQREWKKRAENKQCSPS